MLPGLYTHMYSHGPLPSFTLFSLLSIILLPMQQYTLSETTPVTPVNVICLHWVATNVHTL